VGNAGGLVAFTYAGYVVAGYAIGLASLAGYYAHLIYRGRRARAKVAAVAAKRARSS
jgi:hypothetical protein